MSDSHNHLRPPTNPENYRQLASFLGAIAVCHNSVEIDQDTEERWKDIMALMQEADDIIDDPHATLDSFYDKLHTFNDFSDPYIHLAPGSKNTIVRERLFETTAKIITLGEEAASASSIDDYIQYRIREGFETAALFEDSASDFVRHQENFTDQFLPLLRNMGAAACLLDSMTDLPEDYAQGLAQVRPSIKNRGILLSRSLRYLKPVLPVLKYSGVRHEAAKAMKGYLGRRIQISKITKEEPLGTYQ